MIEYALTAGFVAVGAGLIISCPPYPPTLASSFQECSALLQTLPILVRNGVLSNISCGSERTPHKAALLNSSILTTLRDTVPVHPSVVACAADGQLLPEGFVRTVRRRILQQQWASLTSPESEWRDVPFDPGDA